MSQEMYLLRAMFSVVGNKREFAKVFDEVTREDFENANLGRVFAACELVFDRDHSVCAVEVVEELHDSGTMGDHERWTMVIAEILDGFATSFDILAYAEKVIRAGASRRIDGGDRARETFARMDFSWKRHRKLVTSAADAMAQVLDELDGQDKNPNYVKSGISDLDDKVGGFRPGELIVIAARPGAGKTALAANIALFAAEKQRKKVLFLSLESSTLRLTQNMAQSMGAGLSQHTNTKRQWDNLMAAGDRISGMHFDQIDDTSISVEDLEPIIAGGKYDLLVVDYLQLMIPKREQGRNREQEVSNISRTLKMFTMRYDIPVIALSQLSRAGEPSSGNSKGSRPRLNHLRESGSIEQDADIVLMIYRESLYKPDDESLKGRAEILIEKLRRGETGTVKLKFNGPLLRFSNEYEGGF